MSVDRIDILAVRKSQGLARKDFLKAIQPMLDRRRVLVNERILERIEAGQDVAPERLQAVRESVAERFPEISERKLVKEYSNLWRKMRVPFLIVLLVGTTFGLVFTYIYLPQRHLLSETISLLASAATVVAVIFTIYESRRNR